MTYEVVISESVIRNVGSLLSNLGISLFGIGLMLVGWGIIDISRAEHLDYKALYVIAGSITVVIGFIILIAVTLKVLGILVITTGV